MRGEREKTKKLEKKEVEGRTREKVEGGRN